MSDEHCAEPWIKGHNVMHEPSIRSRDPGKDNGGYVIATFYGTRAHDNANRVLACVNACEGIATDTLEGFSRGFLAMLPDRAHADMQALKEQRGELLAALEGLLPLGDCECPYERPNGRAASAKACADAEAAVTKVKAIIAQGK